MRGAVVSTSVGVGGARAVAGLTDCCTLLPDECVSERVASASADWLADCGAAQCCVAQWREVDSGRASRSLSAATLLARCDESLADWQHVRLRTCA